MKRLATLAAAIVLIVGLAPDASAAAAVVTSFTPTSGPVGTSVTITGEGFDTTTAVDFNGTAATFTIVSPTELTATVPSGATSGPISVTNTDGTGISSTNFTVIPAPVVTGFTPGSGSSGTIVTISGTGFTNASDVQFGGISATNFTVNSDVQITATVPTNAATGPITVVTPGGTDASTDTFEVLVPPTITAFTPKQGTVGSVIVVTGTGLDTTTAVTVDGADADFEIVSSTKLRVIVPRGARSGKIRVTTDAGFAVTNGTFDVIKDRHRTVAAFSLKKHLLALGTVRVPDHDATCKARRRILVQRRINGHWRTVKRTRSRAAGGFRARLRDVEGTYRVIALQKSTVVDLCLKDTSRTLTHHHASGGDGGGGGGGGGGCDPAYPTVCIPSPPPDLDCGDIRFTNFRVRPPDPHGFDGDNDGVGCET
jgi:IPT/TIG domain-containing protein